MKRSWLVHVPGYAPFVMILMNDEDDAESVVKSIWPNGRCE